MRLVCIARLVSVAGTLSPYRDEHRKRVKNGLQCLPSLNTSMPVKTHDGPVDELEHPEGSTARTPRKGRTTAVKKGDKTPT